MSIAYHKKYEIGKRRKYSLSSGCADSGVLPHRSLYPHYEHIEDKQSMFSKTFIDAFNHTANLHPAHGTIVGRSHPYPFVTLNKDVDLNSLEVDKS
jgi:hypothetical protein